MLGKWNNEHVGMSYLNGIPLHAVLARAGFHDYLHMLPRSTVEPHADLLDCIFPGVEGLHERKVQVLLLTLLHVTDLRAYKFHRAKVGCVKPYSVTVLCRKMLNTPVQRKQMMLIWLQLISCTFSWRAARSYCRMLHCCKTSIQTTGSSRCPASSHPLQTPQELTCSRSGQTSSSKSLLLTTAVWSRVCRYSALVLNDCHALLMAITLVQPGLVLMLQVLQVEPGLDVFSERALLKQQNEQLKERHEQAQQQSVFLQTHVSTCAMLLKGTCSRTVAELCCPLQQMHLHKMPLC